MDQKYFCPQCRRIWRINKNHKDPHIFVPKNIPPTHIFPTYPMNQFGSIERPIGTEDVEYFDTTTNLPEKICPKCDRKFPRVKIEI